MQKHLRLARLELLILPFASTPAEHRREHIAQSGNEWRDPEWNRIWSVMSIDEDHRDPCRSRNDRDAVSNENEQCPAERHRPRNPSTNDPN